MTLSLSSSVRPLFFLLVSLKFLLVLKSFKGVSRQFKEHLNFNGSFKEVLRVFQGVSRMFQGCLKGVSRLFQGRFKSISRKFQECFLEV